VQDRYGGENVTMKVGMWQKDMSVIGDFARKSGVPTPLFSATEPIYAAAMSTGHAGDDTASVCAVLEAMAGIKR
jgi:L-threonate 2-dehydrogenase